MQLHVGHVLLALLACGTANSAEARTWVVEADGSGDAPTIQAAILLADVGDFIEVGPGVYRETVYLTGGRDINLRSRLGADVTVIDGEGIRPVLELDAGIVQGFTIRNGFARIGAGVLIGQANAVTSPILRDNVIENNRGTLFRDCCAGSGVYNIATGARIESNVIRNNEVEGVGGGVYDNGMETIIANNVIAFNRAYTLSGGIRSFWSSIYGNLIVGNFGGYDGGGATLEGGVEFHNNTVFGNSIANAFSNTAGVYVNSASTVTENIIVKNRGGRGLVASELATIRCNDVWGNDIDTITGPADPSNFAADPLFCAADPLASLSFVLWSNSPCAPWNSPGGTCSLIGARPVDCSTVAVEKTRWGDVKQLFR